MNFKYSSLVLGFFLSFLSTEAAGFENAGENDSGDTFEKAVRSARAGDCVTAISLFSTIDAASPRYGMAMLNTALCHYHRKEYERAFESLESAQEHGNETLFTAAGQLRELWCHELVQLATSLIEEDEHDRARRILETAAAFDPDDKSGAAELLESITEVPSPWSGFVSLGGGYDTNLARSQFEQQNESGGFVEVEGSVEYAAVSDEIWKLSIGYDLYGQLVPLDFTGGQEMYDREYSYQEHGLWPEAVFYQNDMEWGGRLRPFVSFVDINPPRPFLTGLTLSPFVKHTWWFNLELGAGVDAQWAWSLDSDYGYLEGSSLGGYVWAAYPFVSWLEISITGWAEQSWLGVLFVETEMDSYEVPYSSIAFGGSVDALFIPIEEFNVLMTGSVYQTRFWDSVSRDDGEEEQRIDLMQRYGLNLVWYFYPPLWTEAGYTFEFNDSTIGDGDGPGDYDDKAYYRHEVRACIGVMF